MARTEQDVVSELIVTYEKMIENLKSQIELYKEEVRKCEHTIQMKDDYITVLESYKQKTERNMSYLAILAMRDGK